MADNETPSTLAQGQIPTVFSEASIYEVPTDGPTTLTTVVLCNNSDDDSTVTIYVVPKGQEPAASNVFISNFPLSAHDTVQLTQFAGGWFNPGTRFCVSVSVEAAVNYLLSGVQTR